MIFSTRGASPLFYIYFFLLIFWASCSLTGELKRLRSYYRHQNPNCAISLPYRPNAFHPCRQILLAFPDDDICVEVACTEEHAQYIFSPSS